METLKISKEDFVSKLQQQVGKGKQLLEMNVTSTGSFPNMRGRTRVDYQQDELNSFIASYEKWDNFNKELYKQAFNVQHNSYLRDYASHDTTPWGLDLVNDYKQMILPKVTQMEGDIEKAFLIPCKKSTDSTPQKDSKVESKNVFIVHGHDNVALKDVENFVRKIGLNPIILRDQPNKSQTIIEKIEEYAGNVCYAIVLYTPCDEGKAKEETDLKPRARQNVVFEHGYLCAKLTRSHICALVKAEVEIPGDLSGVVHYKMDEAWEYKVAKDMKAAGITIDVEKLF